MMSKFRAVLMALVALLVLFASSSFVNAQEGATSATTRTAQQESPNSAPAPSLRHTTRTLRTAKTLHASLTTTQKQALQAVLDKHRAELNAVALSFKPSLRTGRSNNADADKAQAATDLQAAKDALAKLKVVEDAITTDSASIFTAEQSAQLKAILDLNNLTLSAREREAARITAPNTAASTQYAASDCATSAYYATFGVYYDYYAYAYATYSYLYSGGSYDTYVYFYYALVYARAGHQEISAAYYDLISLGSDFNGYLEAAITDLYTASLYKYYGYTAALRDYANDNSNYYAYYAYVSGYYGFIYDHDYAYYHAQKCYSG